MEYPKEEFITDLKRCGLTQDEAERRYGTEPPEERQRLGPVMESPAETLWAWLPDSPFAGGRFNPPFPRWLNVKLFGAGRKLP